LFRHGRRRWCTAAPMMPFRCDTRSRRLFTIISAYLINIAIITRLGAIFSMNVYFKV
jgi:hypothetical protein